MYGRKSNDNCFKYKIFLFTNDERLINFCKHIDLWNQLSLNDICLIYKYTKYNIFLEFVNMLDCMVLITFKVIYEPVVIKKCNFIIKN